MFREENFFSGNFYERDNSTDAFGDDSFVEDVEQSREIKTREMKNFNDNKRESDNKLETKEDVKKSFTEELDKKLSEEKKEEPTRREFFKKVAVLMAGATLRGNGQVLKEVFKELEKSVEATEKGEPRISLEIIYGAHRTEKDIEKFIQAIKEADVVVPELFNWSDQALKDYRDVASGNKKPEEVTLYHYLPLADVELEALYNTKKMVFLFDLPRGNPLVTEVIREELNRSSYESYFDIKSWENTLKNLKNSYKRSAEALVRRENFILQNLFQFVESLKQEIKQNPDKTNQLFPDYQKKGVRVLMFLGAAHTRIYQNLKRQEKESKDLSETKREFNEMPMVYSFGAEITRRFVFGKEVPDELVAKEFFCMRFREIFGSQVYQIKDSIKLDIYTRYVFSQFSGEELRNVFIEAQKDFANKQSLLAESGEEKMNKIEKRNYFKLILRYHFENFLKEKNIPILSSDEEVDKLIKEKKLI